MPEDWTLDRLVSFALSLGTLEALDPATIQEPRPGPGLPGVGPRGARDAMHAGDPGPGRDHPDAGCHDSAAEGRPECLRAGVLLLGEEEDAP